MRRELALALVVGLLLTTGMLKVASVLVASGLSERLGGQLGFQVVLGGLEIALAVLTIVPRSRTVGVCASLGLSLCFGLAIAVRMLMGDTRECACLGHWVTVRPWLELLMVGGLLVGTASLLPAAGIGRAKLGADQL